MKAITLWQPWASLWLTERKVHETRHWRTHYRGELIVHAAKRSCDFTVLSTAAELICREEFGLRWRESIPRGCIVGIVQLVDCQSSNEVTPEHADDLACGNWAPNRFIWKRGEYLKLARPKPFAGRQGLWNGPDQVLGT
jgi:hypothetical protein